jgi:hypothetical protein
VTEWEDTVGIGGSIFLIAVGAILAFAVHASLGFVSIQVVGWVLMVAGAVGLILTLFLWSNRRRTVVDRAVERPYADEYVERPVAPRQAVAPDDEVVEERRRTVRYPNQY